MAAAAALIFRRAERACPQAGEGLSHSTHGKTVVIAELHVRLTAKNLKKMPGGFSVSVALSETTVPLFCTVVKSLCVCFWRLSEVK